MIIIHIRKEYNMKKITALILALLMLVSVFAGCGGGTDKGAEDKKTPVGVDKNHSLIAMETENYKITCGMMSYLYLYGFYNMYSQYNQYFDQMGLDTSKPLDEQAYGDDMTWHTYFLDMTMSDARTFLRVAEAAKAAGFSDENCRAEAEKQLAKAAIDNGLTEDEYMVKMFGTALDREDMLNAMMLQIYAYDYYEKMSKDACAEITEEECEKHYNENSAKFNKVDYILYPVIASTANTEDPEAAYAAAKAKAEELAAVAAEKGVDGYKEWVRAYMIQTNSLSSTPMAEDALNNQIDKTLAGYTGAMYSADDEISQWMFESGRKEGDCKIKDNGAGSYSVYIVAKTPYRDDSLTRSVRHIVINPDKYESADAAKAKAEEILAQWQEGEATPESFDELAEKYSNDRSSLYENVRVGEMVQPFNDWLFDTSRKPGDTGIIETEYGYHIMYFMSDSYPVWKLDVINTLAGVTLKDSIKSFEESYTVTENEENIAKLPKSIPATALESSAAPDGVNVYQ